MDNNIIGISIGLALLAANGFLYSEIRSARTVVVFDLVFIAVLIATYFIFKSFGHKR